MAKYKVEISNLDTKDIVVLSNEETLELLRKYKNGENVAKEKLVEGNLKLVLSVLKKYINKCDNMDDLFQVGCIGLIKAIDNFDLTQGVMLSTYAIPMILGEVRRYLRDSSILRISRSLRDLAYKSLQAKEYLINKLNRIPTTKMIAEALGEKEIDVIIAIDSMNEPNSIFEPIYNDGGDTIYLYEQLADNKSSTNDIEDKMSLSKAIKDLSKREQKILDERYIVGKTQMEIASELGISQAQVSRLEKNAIKTLKKVLK